MADSSIEANKALAVQFIENINRHDYAAMERLLHLTFQWITAVTQDDGPNALRPMQSKTLQGKNLHHTKPRLDRVESLAVFKRLFEGDYGGAMTEGRGSDGVIPVQDESVRIRLTIHGLTAEEDRVAMEAESYLLNPLNGRTYNNLYHYLFRVRDGQISLYKEYQDTLHLFDYTAE